MAIREDRDRKFRKCASWRNPDCERKALRRVPRCPSSLGGGTPSILNAGQFQTVLAAIRTAFDFDLSMEHAIELDPRTVTPLLAKTLAEMGVNRASLGVQDVGQQGANGHRSRSAG